MTTPRAVYVTGNGGKEYESQGAVMAELSRILGYTVASISTYDVTTFQDAADGREVYIVWPDPPLTPDDTQEVDAVRKPARAGDKLENSR
jgi:hypothetical protein